MVQDGSDVIRAWEAVLQGPQGKICVQWLAEVAFDNYPVTVTGANGTDPVMAAFRDGAGSMARDILDYAGYRITFERKPDERRFDDDDD